MRRILTLAFTIFFLTFNAFSQETGRSVLNFNSGWKFAKGDFPGADKVNFDDHSWKALDLPHDWSIEGPFSSEWASATGYLPGGTGCTRTMQLNPSSMLDMVESFDILKSTQVQLEIK